MKIEIDAIVGREIETFIRALAWAISQAQEAKVTSLAEYLAPIHQKILCGLARDLEDSKRTEQP